MIKVFINLSIAYLFTLSPDIAISQQVYKCGNTFSQTPCSSDAQKISIEPAIPLDCEDYSNRKSEYCLEKEAKREAARNAALAAEMERKELEKQRLIELEEQRKRDEEQKVREAKKANDTEITRICRAAIAAVMMRPVEIINFVSQSNGVIYTTHTRESDGTIWNHKCMINGSSVIWGPENGRWRNTVHDGKITYEILDEGILIHQKFSDGSGESRLYTQDRLEPI